MAHVQVGDAELPNSGLPQQLLLEDPVFRGQPRGPTSGVDSTAARPPRNRSERSRARKWKWSPAEDTWLLQEAKAHSPHTKKFGGIGEAHAAIASALNDSRRLP
jgi:hypothetical protein